jgi:GNAT superfamily N-acetyltransferase
MTAVHIRTMTPADLDFAASCTAAEGWGAQRGAFEGFHAYDPEGCLVAEVGGPGAFAGARIGICVATPYGEQGFLGMLIVRPEARGRGVGRRLLERAIAYLRGRGARSIYLDGVLAAVPLYERLGFRKQCRSLRFGGTVAGRAHAHVRPLVEADLDAVCALDRLAFGADRSFFLKRLLAQGAALCKVLEQEGQIGGYILGQRTGGLVAAGPWVVRPQVARPADLLEGLAVEARGDVIGLGLLETNRAAAGTVRALGLAERADPPWRMALALSDAPDKVEALGASPLAYAVGSPAKG